MASQEDIILLVKTQMSSSASLVSEEGYESAVNSAVSELGFAITDGNPTRILWLVKRAVRHSLFILWVASAQKFKYKNINLQNRFEQYSKLIEFMDNEFSSALQSEPQVFASVDSYKIFGTIVRAGFCYDSVGRELSEEEVKRYIQV